MPDLRQSRSISVRTRSDCNISHMKHLGEQTVADSAECSVGFYLNHFSPSWFLISISCALCISSYVICPVLFCHTYLNTRSNAWLGLRVIAVNHDRATVCSSVVCTAPDSTTVVCCQHYTMISLANAPVHSGWHANELVFLFLFFFPHIVIFVHFLLLFKILHHT